MAPYSINKAFTISEHVHDETWIELSWVETKLSQRWSKLQLNTI